MGIGAQRMLFAGTVTFLWSLLIYVVAIINWSHVAIVWGLK